MVALQSNQGIEIWSHPAFNFTLERRLDLAQKAFKQRRVRRSDLPRSLGGSLQRSNFLYTRLCEKG